MQPFARSLHFREPVMLHGERMVNAYHAFQEKKIRLILKNEGRGMESATAPRLAPTNNCMTMIHQRFVFSKSTIGLHSGLITQGRYNQLVYKAMSVFEIPNRLNMITATVITTT